MKEATLSSPLAGPGHDLTRWHRHRLAVRWVRPSCQGGSLAFADGRELRWRGLVLEGTGPWRFLTVPPEICEALAVSATHVSYGWGMVPVTAHIGGTRWKTSLFPKDGRYLVPVRASVRSAEGIELGDTVTVHLHVDG
jgi:Domain of unknown function (DUF1905)